jgi:peptidylprolyl isomerase
MLHRGRRLAGLVLCAALAGCGGDDAGSPTAWNLRALPDAGPTLREHVTPAGTVVRVTREGAGAPAVGGELVDLRFEARTLSGALFDEGLLVTDGATPMRKQPQPLEEGISGMRVGEKRRVLVPGLGGWRRSPKVAPDAATVFDVERIPTLRVDTVDLKEGSGDVAKLGATVTAHYRGTLKDGTVFDASYDRGKPLVMGLVPGSLIEGWLRGIPGMRVGGVRVLRVPSDLGYGKQGTRGIPPDAELTFEVELLDAK